METVITVLYLFVPVVSVAAYIPQIVHLARNPQAGQAISLPTWMPWIGTSVVSLGYVALVVHDPLLTVANAANVVGQSVIVGFAVRARLSKPCEVLEPRELQPATPSQS